MQSSIDLDKEAILSVKIPLRGGDPMDQEINAYGVLAKAEKMVFQYFAIEAMKKKEMELLKPTSPLSVA